MTPMGLNWKVPGCLPRDLPTGDEGPTGCLRPCPQRFMLSSNPLTLRRSVHHHGDLVARRGRYGRGIIVVKGRFKNMLATGELHIRDARC